MMPAKTYRAATMPAALDKVHAELGPDALVLASRKVLAGPLWQVWREPEFEVLAAPPHPSFSPDEKRQEREEGPGAGALWPESLARVHQQLIAQGIDERLAAQVASNAAEMLGPRALRDCARVRDQVVRDLSSRITAGQYLPRRGEPCVIVLVGPSGVGKTSAAAKLAAYAHYTLGRRAALITLDTFRVGALAQIQTFSEILRLPLAVAYTPADLTAALADHGETDVIVIDTPGRNPRRPAEMVELAALLTPLPLARRTFLVAPATAKLSDALDSAEAFRGLGLNGLLFTKMDETDTFGPLYSLACRAELPASYLCSGPRVPQDFEPASVERLVDLMLKMG